MSNAQEIRVMFRNGEVGNGEIVDLQPTFRAKIELTDKEGTALGSLPSLPFDTATGAFDAFAKLVDTLASVRQTTVEWIDNINNCGLVSSASQRQILANHGITATVKVNGV